MPILAQVIIKFTSFTHNQLTILVYPGLKLALFTGKRNCRTREGKANGIYSKSKNSNEN